MLSCLGYTHLCYGCSTLIILMGYGNHDLERDITLVRLLFHFIILLCQTSYARLLVDFYFQSDLFKIVGNKCLHWRFFHVPSVSNGQHLSYFTRYKTGTSMEGAWLTLVSHFVTTSFLLTYKIHFSSSVTEWGRSKRLTFAGKRLLPIVDHCVWFSGEN